MKDLETVKPRIYQAVLRDRTVLADVRRAAKWAATIRPDGSWKDIDYPNQRTSVWLAWYHLRRVRAMAAGYRMKGHALFGNADVCRKALAGIDYWLAKDFRNKNWWWNCIGVPRTLGDTYILLEEFLTDEQRSQGDAIMGRGYKNGQWAYHGPATGQNLVWMTGIHVTRGCLNDQPAEAGKAFKRMAKEVFVSKREGIQADHSFHQHGPCLFSGGYGRGFSIDCSRFAWLAHGTRWQFSKERMDLLTSYVLDGQQWMVRGKHFDYGVVGREIARAGLSAAELAYACDYLIRLRSPRSKELAAFAQRLRGQAGPGQAAPAGNRYFWRSAFMVHRRAGYHTSVRMFRADLWNTDGAHNREGLRSHHLSDGVAYVMLTGDEYRDIFPVWDWRRVPGITAERSRRQLEAKHVHRKGLKTFAGGVSDGTYGAAAMDYTSPWHGEGFPKHRLRYRKAWFYFDREFVALTAGLTCVSDNPVQTSLNQCHLRGPVTTSAGPLSKGAGKLTGPAWVHHDSVGYVLPEGAAATAAAKTQTGSWKAVSGNRSGDRVACDVFSLSLEHGVGPKGVSFSYIVVPAVSAKQLADYAKTARVKIVANTTARQAVWHAELKMLQAVLHKAGKVSTGDLSVAADGSCLLLVKETDTGVQIAAACPDRSGKLTVTIDRKLTGAGCTWSAKEGLSTVTFDLPAGQDLGKSVVRKLKTAK